MRLLALLLSLYVLCLSCLPCTDEVQVCVEQTQAQTTMQAAPHSDFGKHTNDGCSLLCQCQCCAGTVVASLEVAPLSFASPVPCWATDLRHAPLLVGTPTHAAGAVWQPPQA